MTQPELVLDLSVDGLSLWQPAAATDWTLLGFASLDDPDLGTKIAEMRAAGVAAVGPDFVTMLLLPDDHIWVQRLHLHGLTARAKDENARQAMAQATSLPISGFSVAYGDTDKRGATAVAATTTEVLEEARKFARDNGFNPKTLASRSFFDGFSTRAIFADAPKPMAFLPRKADVAAPVDRTAQAPVAAKFKLPVIRRDWALAGAAIVAVVGAFTYWALDPYEQFLRPPKVAETLAEFTLPDAGVTPPALAIMPNSDSTRVAPALPQESIPANIILASRLKEQNAPVQVAVSFDAAGVYFATVPAPPSVPAGLGGRLHWNAPASMFLDVPDAEPSIGVAAMQKLPSFALVSNAPQDSGFLASGMLGTVSTRSAANLDLSTLDAILAPSITNDPADFAYRDGTGVLDQQSLSEIAITSTEGVSVDPPELEGLQFASLTTTLVTHDSADVLIDAPLPQVTAPGVRPLARPEAFSIIQPAEATAALTPASESQQFGPVWPGPPPVQATYPVTEFAPGAPGHVRPEPRAAAPDVASIPAAPERPVFGPEWSPQSAPLAASATEFDAKNPAHVRPLPRLPLTVAKAAAAAAEASIVALNLPASAALDVGLDWQEYNADNPGHVRPKTRPSSLQQLAEAGDLAPTLLAIKASVRPHVRPVAIAAIMLARAEEIAFAQAAAAEAEARAQSVAELAALAIAESQPEEATPALLDPDLAALDDAEPETDVQVASLPTSADVAEAATIEGAIDRGQISLIGIYGTESKRRALIRLASGRYERVTVGDSISGWQVAAIGKDAIKLVKSGREAFLKMPN